MKDFISSFMSRLDFGMIDDFETACITILTLVGIILVLLGLAYAAKWVIFKLYVNCSNEKVQKAVTKIIYELDNLCDKISNKEKRKEAISAVKDLFIWRNIPIPEFVIGVIIDCEVAAIRKLQKQFADEKDPYLHPDCDEQSEDTDNTDVGEEK